MFLKLSARRPGTAVAALALLLGLGFQTNSARADGSANVTLLSNRNAYSYHSGIWGYTAPNGTELAIIGTQSGTSFVNVTVPTNPVEVAFIPGTSSTWREIRCYGTYAYISNEDGGGLAIVDMTNPLSPSLVRNYTTYFTTCHSLHIDTQTGYLYCNGTNNGMIILNVGSNPTLPPSVATYNTYYVHDCYSRDGIGYFAEISNEQFSIVEVNHLPTFTNRSTTTYAGAFTHNAWLTDDSQYLLTTDELAGGHIRVWDVSNLNSPVQVGGYAIPGDDSIVHNVYVRGNLAIASWYTAGLQILDISNPLNPVRVGYYDTYPGTGQFSGAWGVYPFAQNGNIYISDMQTGLYVFQFNPNYGIVNGVVRDAANNQPIAGASVRNTLTGVTVQSSGTGAYSVSVDPGMTPIEYSKFAYATQTINVVVSQGQTVTQNVSLNRLPAGSMSGAVKNASGGAGISGAAIEIVATPLSTTSGVAGSYSFSSIPVGGYVANVSRIGFGAKSFPFDIAANQNTPKDFYLSASVFADDAETNQGWQLGVSGDNASSGIWVRADPVGTGGGAVQPEDDHTPAPGVTCFVTGNCSPGCGIGDNDVDSGRTTLMSPTLNLSTMVEPRLRYYRWFTNNAGGSPNQDPWKVDISSNGGTTWVPLENTLETLAAWTAFDFRVRDFITPTNNVKVRFIAQDISPGSIVEAAVDDFEIYETPGTSDVPAGNLDLAGVRLLESAPNPAFGSTLIRFRLPSRAPALLEVLDVQGRRVRRLLEGQQDAGLHQVAWDGLDDAGRPAPAGIYLQRLVASGVTSAQKLSLLR